MKRKHIGSDLEGFLEEEGILESSRADAIKFSIAHELEAAMKKKRITKSEMARRLHTSRTGIERLLDPSNTSVTLHTLAKVATVLGKRIEFSLR